MNELVPKIGQDTMGLELSRRHERSMGRGVRVVSETLVRPSLSVLDGKGSEWFDELVDKYSQGRQHGLMSAEMVFRVPKFRVPDVNVKMGCNLLIP